MKYIAYIQKIVSKNLLITDNVLLLQRSSERITIITMRATILQISTVWGKPVDNQRNAERLIDSAPPSDIYVLPEMWSTGFATSPSGIAEDEHESRTNGSLAWMKRMAVKHNAAISGSLSVKTDEGYYANRLYFVTPDGKTEYYDKKHLFFGGGESENYHAGNKRTVVSYMGVRFLLIVCYDLRFPVWIRSDNDYDVILCTANWPEARQEVWDTLLRARAIENQCFAIGANRTGEDPLCSYSGGSQIISPYGKSIATCGKNEEICTAELDFDKLERFRKVFPVLNDRD